MTARLPSTAAELERWRRERLVLPIWWRDDDAVAPSPALDRLLQLADRFDAPLHLAVVPQPATRELAECLRGRDGTFVLVHGWRHLNHAPPGDKKAEFGPHRATATMLEEIACGKRRLQELFGTKALTVFTPPWNRVAPAVVEGLHGAGFHALSTFMPRTSTFAAANVLQVNTHLDPINWKQRGGLHDVAWLDELMCGHLVARRTGTADNTEPYGLLTHHLVQDEATWDFTERLIGLLLGSGARWTLPFNGLI